MPNRSLSAVAFVALAAFAVPSLRAQRPGGPPPSPQAPGAGERPGNGARGQQPQGPKPYIEVVTDKAVSDTGVFIVHRIGDQLLFEIPRAQLGRQFLLLADLAGAQDGTGYAGVVSVSHVVRWERLGDRVLLRSVGYDVVADSSTPVSRAVRLNNVEPIIMSFDVAAWSPNDSNAVIDVTRLFTTDVPELAVNRRQDRARHFDPSRSLIDRAKVFPTNLNVRAIQTWSSDSVPNDRSLGTITEVVQYSMVLLPEQLASRRLCDNRVGFFSTEQTDYGTDRAARGEALLHRPLAAGAQGPGRRGLRPGQADRVLHRPGHAGAVGALADQGRGGLAAGLPVRGLQQRHHRQARADAAGGPEFQHGRRPVLVRALAPVDHRERVRSARLRSADGRDPPVEHRLLPQRDEPAPGLVLRAGRRRTIRARRCCRSPTR